MERPSVADLLCCSFTPSLSLSYPWDEEEFPERRRDDFSIHLARESDTHTEKDWKGEENNNIRWWPGLISRSHQWEYSDKLHQSSWYRCNQCNESDVYKMTAELPEEAHRLLTLAGRPDAWKCRCFPITLKYLSVPKQNTEAPPITEHSCG